MGSRERAGLRRRKPVALGREAERHQPRTTSVGHGVRDQKRRSSCVFVSSCRVVCARSSPREGVLGGYAVMTPSRRMRARVFLVSSTSGSDVSSLSSIAPTGPR
jgi:hypothetical protein